MKKLFLLIATAAILLASPYTGFMKLSKGAWAKYEVYGQNHPFILTTKYLGTTTYKGKKVNVIETEMKVENMEVVTQYWSAIGNDSLLKKVITKTPNGMSCFEEEMIGTIYSKDQGPGYHTTTPKRFNPKKPNITYATYTLPNGKKIKAAIFKEGDTEVWVSSQVPFGIVQVKEKGKMVMRLIDFGLSGAKAKIGLKEAKMCTMPTLPIPSFQ